MSMINISDEVADWAMVKTALNEAFPSSVYTYVEDEDIKVFHDVDDCPLLLVFVINYEKRDLKVHLGALYRVCNVVGGHITSRDCVKLIGEIELKLQRGLLLVQDTEKFGIDGVQKMMVEAEKQCIMFGDTKDLASEIIIANRTMMKARFVACIMDRTVRMSVSKLGSIAC